MIENQNFISVDGKTARNSAGEYFSVGETVAHQHKSAGTAEILRFEVVLERNEIRAHTPKGHAGLDFLVKLS